MKKLTIIMILPIYLFSLALAVEGTSGALTQSLPIDITQFFFYALEFGIGCGLQIYIYLFVLRSYLIAEEKKRNNNYG